MTEIGMALTNPYEGKRIPGYVGTPFPGVEAAFLDPETNEIHNNADTEGELLIKSKCMFDRYLDKPEATEKTFCTDPSTG